MIEYKKIMKLLFVAVFMLPCFAAMAQETSDELPTVLHISASSTERHIDVQWQLPKHDQLSGVHLYRKAYPLPLQKDPHSKTIERGQLIASLAGDQLHYQDTQVKPGFYYYYRVVLVGDKPRESKLSPPALAALKDYQPPSEATLLAVDVVNVADDQQIKLQWQASRSDDVMAYRIYRSTQKGSAKIIHILNLEVAGESQFTQHLKPMGNLNYIYQYTIVAVDGAGNLSKHSNMISLRLPDKLAPQPPALLTAQQKDSQVELSWQASAENDFEGYRIYRRAVQANATFELLQPNLLRDNTFVDKSAQPLTAYRYRVAAVDQYANESQATRGILFRTQASKKINLAPQAVTLTEGDKGYPQLNWQKPSKNNMATGFIVFRSEGGAFFPVSGLLKVAHFIDYSATTGLAYNYRIQAIDNTGQGSKFSVTLLWSGEGK